MFRSIEKFVRREIFHRRHAPPPPTSPSIPRQGDPTFAILNAQAETRVARESEMRAREETQEAKALLAKKEAELALERVESIALREQLSQLQRFQGLTASMGVDLANVLVSDYLLRRGYGKAKAYLFGRSTPSFDVGRLTNLTDEARLRLVMDAVSHAVQLVDDLRAGGYEDAACDLDASIKQFKGSPVLNVDDLSLLPSGRAEAIGISTSPSSRVVRFSQESASSSSSHSDQSVHHLTVTESNIEPGEIGKQSAISPS